jgi:acetyltransferase EpsM
MKPSLVIIGAGGHAKVVCDAVLKMNTYAIVGFVDARIPVGTEIMNGLKVILPQSELEKLPDFAGNFVVAIGNNQVRNKLFNELKELLKPAVIVHPFSSLSAEAKIGRGSVVLAGAVINAFSAVGENSIVNSGVVIDHESIIGNNVHLSIGTMVGSNSEVEDGVTTEVGQNLPSFSIVKKNNI